MTPDSPIRLVKDLPSTEEIALLTRRLHQLLDNPHPGLATWLVARTEAALALRDALNKVL